MLVDHLVEVPEPVKQGLDHGVEGLAGESGLGQDAGYLGEDFVHGGGRWVRGGVLISMTSSINCCSML